MANEVKKSAEELYTITNQNRSFSSMPGNSSNVQHVTDIRETASDVKEALISGRTEEKQKIVATPSFPVYRAQFVNLFNQDATSLPVRPRWETHQVCQAARGNADADVLLWSVLAGAAWVFFEWLDYHFLTIISFVLTLGMVVQFGWSMRSRKKYDVPRMEIPEELFVDIGAAVGAHVDNFLEIHQNISCEGDLKQFLMVIAGFVVAAFIGSWFNLISVSYIGFVSAHTLPVFYKKYHDQVVSLIGSQYQKLDKGVLSKIPKWSLKFKKSQ